MTVHSDTELLSGKVAIVTGAGGGIGRAIALELAAQGAAVVVNDIGADLGGHGQNSTAAQAVVAEIQSAGGRAIANTDSVSEWDNAQRIVATAIAEFGRIDIVVNNAGILRDAIFHKLAPEDWISVTNVHLNGAFFVARAAAERFRAQCFGRMIFMTSASGLIGNLGQAAYSAAKLGIVGLSKSIALDMARYGVTSNCICPFAWTRMADSIPADTPEEKARVDKLKRMEPRKIAPLAAYLGCDASAEVSGQIFAVRANEIFLMSQNRPLRAVHRDSGWTPRQIADHAIPAFQAQFYPLDRSADVFSWDPI